MYFAAYDYKNTVNVLKLKTTFSFTIDFLNHTRNLSRIEQLEQSVNEIKAKIHYDSNRNRIGFVIVMLGFMATLFLGCLQFTKLFQLGKNKIVESGNIK